MPPTLIGIKQINLDQLSGFIIQVESGAVPDLSNVVFTSGDQNISGVKTFFEHINAEYVHVGSDVAGNSTYGANSISWDSASFIDNTQGTIYFTHGNDDPKIIFDTVGGSIQTPLLKGSSIVSSTNESIEINLNDTYLKDTAGTQSIDWGARTLKDDTLNSSIQWNSRLLINSANDNVLDWENGIIYNAVGLYLDFTNATFNQLTHFGQGAWFEGGASLQGNTIDSVADPVNSQDAATKNYVDNLISGISGSSSYKVKIDVATGTQIQSVSFPSFASIPYVFTQLVAHSITSGDWSSILVSGVSTSGCSLIYGASFLQSGYKIHLKAEL